MSAKIESNLQRFIITGKLAFVLCSMSLGLNSTKNEKIAKIFVTSDFLQIWGLGS